MINRKTICELVAKGGNAWYKDGEQITIKDRIVNIGETCDCDVRYETGLFLPEHYATILQDDEDKSWRIVKRSQFVDVSLDGKGSIGYVCTLTDGDIIRIEGQKMALLFHIKEECEPNRRHAWRWATISIAVCFIVMAYLWGVNGRRNITEEDVEALETSIFLIKVDSVEQLLKTGQREYKKRPTKIFDSNSPIGTAFLTTDSIIVTARHCVEYWIGTDLDLRIKVENLQDNDIIKWAVETETFNQLQQESSDSVMLINVFFSVFDCFGNKKYSFSSTDSCVHINKEHDGIFLLGDFVQDYYWRSIRPYFVNKKMALGDILWIDGVAEKGKIKLAEIDDIKAMKRGTSLMICGYPKTGMGDKRVIFASGTIKREISLGKENLFFDSNINYGFSGGPVLTKDHGNILAVGVVSCVDSISNGLYKWAVPVSEIAKKGRR